MNKIRPRVKQWSENGYAGVTGITKRLLEHWLDPEERKDRRFFFCQLEGDEGERKYSKKEQAEKVRQTVYTVGKVGQLGEQIQNLISVGMLSEGWDAHNVTHIMGLRLSRISGMQSGRKTRRH